MARRFKNTAWSSRPKRVLVLFGVLATVVGVVYGGVSAVSALGKPSPPTVTSINLAGSSPTNAATVSWTVTFSASVTGGSASNFTLVPSGGVSGASISSVSGSGSTRTVTASTGSGSGTLQLNLTSDTGITGSNGTVSNTLNGQAYTIDKTPPTVSSSSIMLAGSSPTFASSVSWTVTFSESVTGVTTSDFSLVNSGLSGTPLVTGVSGSGTVYTVTAATGTGTGTLGLEVPGPGSITDLAGNPLSAAPGSFPVTGPTYTFVAQPLSLFAGDATCSDTGISLGGKYNVFWGAHSNGAFIVNGSYNTFGTSDAGCTPSIGGKGNAFGRDSEAAPSAGPNNLPYPETYDQTNVCSHSTHPIVATYTISNSSSGIYCATSQINFASSNITATVTLVAPSIQMNGSGLNLTPAYGNLIAYDPSTVVGNTGLSIALSGGSDTFNKGTLYDPYGALTVGGSGSNFDGFFEAYTISISGSNNTFTGEGPASYLSVTGNVTVWPGGGPVQIPVTFTDNNGTAETVTSLNVSIENATVPSGCNPADFTIGPSNVSPTMPINVPPNGTVTLPDPINAPGVTAPTITYADHGDQHLCEGATFTLSYLATDTNGTDTGTVTVGTPTAWTVRFGTPTSNQSGVLLLPTALNDPNATIDTVPVTVKNNDAGAEYLHQVIYEITPGWSACAGSGTNHSGTCSGGTANGDAACVAADFSINGNATPGAPSTVPYNEEIGPNGNATPTPSFTIQMIDNHQNQDACEGVQVSITVNAS